MKLTKEQLVFGQVYTVKIGNGKLWTSEFKSLEVDGKYVKFNTSHSVSLENNNYFSTGWLGYYETFKEIRLPSPEELEIYNKNLPKGTEKVILNTCLLYTSPSPRDGLLSRMPSSA